MIQNEDISLGFINSLFKLKVKAVEQFYIICIKSLQKLFAQSIMARELQSADKEKKGWREWLIDTEL